MSTIESDVAIELAHRQLEAATVAETEARTRYQAVQQRISELGESEDDGEGDGGDGDAAVLANELEQAGQAFEDAHSESERTRGNLEAAERRSRLAAVEGGRPAAVARGGRRELTYRPDVRGRSFFRDAYLAQFGMDTAARERLDSHGREMEDEFRDRGIVLHEPETRDVGTGAFTGLVTPVYLEEQFVELRRAMFPLYEGLSKLPLPATGMTVNIGRLTTGTGVAAQASENAAVQETDADDTLLTINVRTYSGQQDLSRQSIERGVNVDEVIFRDLSRAYLTRLGDAVYNADGTSGTHLGIRSTAGIISVTYTDATPTVPELWPKLQDAIQQVNAGLFAPANVITMAPRRWGWMNAAVDGSLRPFVTPNTAVAVNPFAVGGAAGYGAPVGSISGLPVMTDGNVPLTAGAGTEDVIFILNTSELFFWQEGSDGMPRRFQFEQAAAPQSIRLAVWGYSAFSAGRLPAASAIVIGTGLIAPVF
jgi:HK97 family phage major capsid protein